MERLRPSLTGYCYRMLGSGFEAEDATQETLLRAWRRSDTLVEQAALKSWLFTIATNVCLDQIDARKRRARPVDLADPGTAESPSARRCRRRAGCCRSPAARSPTRTPTPRRRPPSGRRCASPSSPPSSTCPRASASSSSCARCCAGAPRRSPRCSRPRSPRSTAPCSAPAPPSTSSTSRTAKRRPGPPTRTSAPARAVPRGLRRVRHRPHRRPAPLRRRLRHAAAAALGPRPRRGRRLHARPGRRLRGSKLIARRANGLPAFASYKPDPESGDWLPWSVTLLEATPGDGGGTAVAGVHNFLAPYLPNLFRSFGLPERLGDADPVIASA